MKTIRGLFFDMDGTLVDSFMSNFEAYRLAIESVGRTIDLVTFAPTFGQRVDVFLPALFPDISTEDIELIKKEKTRVLPQFVHLARPNQPLINFIRSVRGHHTTVLVTTATLVNALVVLKALAIEDLFDYFVTGDIVSTAKPHPEAYLKALEVTGLKVDEVLAFEDSETGIASARAAGIMTLTIKIPEEAL